MTMEIGNIDKQLSIEKAVTESDIVWYNARTADVDIYGLIDTGKQFIRMPTDKAAAVSPDVLELHVYTAGGRVRLKTDSEYLAIRATWPLAGDFTPHMNYVLKRGFDAYEKKEDGTWDFVGAFMPKVEENEGYESVIHFETRRTRDLMVNFPLFSEIHDLYIGVQQDATLTPGSKYAIKKPVVFYGSSITHGACASRPGNCHVALCSRSLDFDFINLGFAGSAKGEKEMAEYLASLDMSVFVMDYDFNSSWQALQRTHWRMYEIFRKAQPDTPIVFASQCALRWEPKQYKLTMRRRSIIRDHLEKARAMGDDKVFWVDGQKVYPAFGGDNCTVDGIHPNDLGFYAMAIAYSKEIKKALEVADHG